MVGIADATHNEYAEASGAAPQGTAVVSQLECSLSDTSIELKLVEGTRLAAMHVQDATVTEYTTCNYGLEPAVQHIANQHGMVVSATDDTGEVRAIERRDHRYFMATLYQPQLRSSADSPHPVLAGLVAAALAT